jgi:hypothetical protein
LSVFLLFFAIASTFISSSVRTLKELVEFD